MRDEGKATDVSAHVAPRLAHRLPPAGLRWRWLDRGMGEQRRIPIDRLKAAWAVAGAAVRKRPAAITFLVLAAIVSCVGPRCYYGYDQDRDFMRAVRLLGGDWSVLVTAHLQFVGRLKTLGAIFYGIIAPFVWVSKDIRWLYLVIDALAFLSVLPARRIYRLFFDDAAVDALTVMWAMNTARIVFEGAGWHPSLTQLSVPLWQLVELRLVRKPTLRCGLAAALLAALNVSLHLSTLAAIAVLPVLWLAHRGSEGWRWILRALEVVGVALCGVLMVFLARRLSASSVGAAITRLDYVIDTLLGFETRFDVLAGGSVYRGPMAGAVRLAIDLLIVAGLATVVLDRKVAERNGRLLRTWCVVHVLVFLSVFAFYGALDLVGDPAAGVPSVTPPPSRYTNGFYAVAMVFVFAALRRVTRWLRPRTAPAIGGCYALAALHLANMTAYRLRGRTAVVEVGPPMNGAPYELLTEALDKWNVSAGWIFSSTRVAGAVPTSPPLPFYIDWLARRHGHDERRMVLRPGTALVMVRAGGAEEGAARDGALDRVEAGDWRGYLRPYTADTLTYESHFMDGDVLEYALASGSLFTRYAAGGSVSGYVGSRLQPPADAFAELSYELVIDGTDGVHVATYMELPVVSAALRMSLDDDRLLASSLRLLGRGGRLLARLDYPIAVRGERPEHYAGRAVVRGRWVDFVVADIDDIRLELTYQDPSHYPEPRWFDWSVMRSPAWSPEAPAIVWRRVDAAAGRREFREELRRYASQPGVATR